MYIINVSIDITKLESVGGSVCERTEKIREDFTAQVEFTNKDDLLSLRGKIIEGLETIKAKG